MATIVTTIFKCIQQNKSRTLERLCTTCVYKVAWVHNYFLIFFKTNSNKCQLFAKCMWLAVLSVLSSCLLYSAFHLNLEMKSFGKKFDRKRCRCQGCCEMLLWENVSLAWDIFTVCSFRAMGFNKLQTIEICHAIF